MEEDLDVAVDELGEEVGVRMQAEAEDGSLAKRLQTQL